VYKASVWDSSFPTPLGLRHDSDVIEDGIVKAVALQEVMSDGINKAVSKFTDVLG